MNPIKPSKPIKLSLVDATEKLWQLSAEFNSRWASCKYHKVAININYYPPFIHVGVDIHKPQHQGFERRPNTEIIYEIDNLLGGHGEICNNGCDDCDRIHIRYEIDTSTTAVPLNTPVPV